MIYIPDGKILNGMVGDDFYTHQPYLELNTNYYSYKLCEENPLYSIVSEVYQVNDYNNKKNIAIPDACADIMIFYTNSKAYCYVMGGGRELYSMNEMPFFKEVHTIFGVRFHTGTLTNLFKEQIQDAGATEIDGRDAFINGAELVEQLEEADSFLKRWGYVEEYLIKRLNEDYEKNIIINYITKNIIHHHGNIQIKTFEDETGYSGRYLRRIVKDNLGVTMKQLSELIQFQWAYHIYKTSDNEVSLSDLAIQSGYYDQSHMNSRCKKLTGILPKKILHLYD